MNTPIDASLFDRIAESELHAIEDALDDVDPDVCEVENAGGVLTLTFADGSRVVINSHRAARQIWMAAHFSDLRRAWHFSPDEADGAWRWTVDGVTLRATLGQLVRPWLNDLAL